MPRRSAAAVILGLCLCLFGAAAAVGGFALLNVGGSPAFSLIGVGTVIGGAIMMARPLLGAVIYGFVLAGTALWSLAEVGGDLAQLAPRLLIPVVFGVLVVISAICSGGRKKHG